MRTLAIAAALALLPVADVTAQPQSVSPIAANAYYEGLCTPTTCPTSNLTQAIDGDAGTAARLDLSVGLLGGVGLTVTFASPQPTTAVVLFDVETAGLTVAEVIQGARIDLLSSGSVVASATYGGALVSVLTPGSTVARLAFGGDVSFDEARLVYASAVSLLTNIYVVEAFSDPTGTLPVELTAFTGAADGADGAVLRWTTASETDNAGFTVEQRIGSTWRDVAFVAGRGTTSEATDYTRRIDGLAPGRHAFRLRQVDLDGAATLSPTVEVSVGLDRAVTVHAPSPNPARHATRVSLDVAQGGRVAVALYDALGRRVALLHDAVVGDGTRLDLDVDAGALAPGTYVVAVNGTRTSQTRTLTVLR